MEFLKAYEEATKFGLTKEEFMRIWEMEVAHKQTEKHNGRELQSIHRQDQQSDFIDYQGPPTSFPQNKYSNQWQLETDSFQRDLQPLLDCLGNQMFEKQENQWKQLWQKYDQLHGEFQSNFSVLINHVTNTTESNTSSLKLFFMQEVELLKQDLKMALEKQGSRQNTLLASETGVPQKQVQQYGNTSSARVDPHQQAKVDSQKQNDLQYGDTFSTRVDFCEQPKVDNSLYGNVKQPRESVDESLLHKQKQHQNHKEQLPVKSGLGITFMSEQIFGVEMNDPNGKLQNKDAQFANSANTGGNQDTTVAVYRKNIPQTFKQKADSQKFPANSGVSNSSSNVSSSKPSYSTAVQGTGAHADSLSKQTTLPTWVPKTNLVSQEKGSSKSKDKNELAENSSKGHAASGTSTLRANSSANLKQDSIQHIPTECVSFTIDSVDTFCSMREHYLTPFYYTESEACKIRFRVCFNATGQLNVFFLVSNGRNNDNKPWPIQFAGSGFIYNESSRTPSQLWTLGPLACSKPKAGEEIAYTALIKLKTLRNEHSDVTYEIMRTKGYALNNRLNFDWNLSACEK